jgi:hypothetical protein
LMRNSTRYLEGHRRTSKKLHQALNTYIMRVGMAL